MKNTNDMKKKTILIDMDGVICDYTEHMLELATGRFSLPRLRASEVSEFYTERMFPPEYHAPVDELSLEEEFFLNLPPIHGSIEAINEMLENPALSVWICSSPKKTSDHCHSEKFLWLRKHFGQAFAERLILSRDKTLVSGDFLIDDKPIICGERTPEWEHVIFDQPYNRDIQEKKRLDWHNWREVLGI